MILFELKPTYDVNTGKLIGHNHILKDYICDYCGEIIDDPDFDDYAHHSYGIEEYDGLEPFFSEDQLIINNQQIDLYSLMYFHANFTYCYFNLKSCERNLMEYAYDNKSIVTLSHAMYNRRWEVVKDLIEKNKYTLENFQLEVIK